MSTTPQPLREVAEVMTDFDRTWVLCGGWAVDSWVGRQTREHVDVDLAVFHDDQVALRDYLADGWLLNGHDELDDSGTEQWTGRRLGFPSHVHARTDAFNLDFQLELRDGDDWVLREHPRLALPLARIVRPSPWGLPTLAPEAVLLYKAAGEIRPHDQADFDALLPMLDRGQRGWLQDAIVPHGPAHPWLDALRRVGIGVLCMLLVVGCGAADPGDSGTADPSVTLPVESADVVQSIQPTQSSPAVEPGDPSGELTGRAVEALGTGGVDVVMRIGAEGFRLPDGERLYDVHDDRVLAARPGKGRGDARLVVRNLDGDLIREIATGMQVPQTGIVRGDDVYFAGIDLGDDATDLDLATDRGVWVAHGDAPPAPVLPGKKGVAVYTAIERSPDGRTVGIWRCGKTCATLLVGPDGDVVEVPRPGLIALTNNVALLIGAFRDVTAYAIDDGAELWRAETAGIYYGRYAAADGERMVLSSVEPAADGGSSTGQLRIELLDATTGAVERTVLVSTETALLTVVPSLSTDRYVALLDSVLPNADAGPHAIHLVDLDAGVLLEVELLLGDVP